MNIIFSADNISFRYHWKNPNAPSIFPCIYLVSFTKMKKQTFGVDNSLLAMYNSLLTMDISLLAMYLALLAMDNSLITTSYPLLAVDDSLLAMKISLLAMDNFLLAMDNSLLAKDNSLPAMDSCVSRQTRPISSHGDQHITKTADRSFNRFKVMSSNHLLQNVKILNILQKR